MSDSFLYGMSAGVCLAVLAHRAAWWLGGRAFGHPDWASYKAANPDPADEVVPLVPAPPEPGPHSTCGYQIPMCVVHPEFFWPKGEK